MKEQENLQLGNVDRCMICGAVIPEGRQICPECERSGAPLEAFEIGNPYYDYLIHEVQVVCNCPPMKAAAIVSYVNSMGSNPLEFIRKLPDYIGQPHPDADQVLRSLEHIREKHGIRRYCVCFPEGYVNRKERRRREKEERKAKKGKR